MADDPADDQPREKTTAELLRENLALRRELAKLQRVQPDEVCQWRLCSGALGNRHVVAPQHRLLLVREQQH